MRIHRKQVPVIAISALFVLLCACQRPAAEADTAAAPTATADEVAPAEEPMPLDVADELVDAAASAEFVWPESLNVIGDGYPNIGDACRRIGESAATSDFLDDAADLVGCPGKPDDGAATAIAVESRGRVVGEVDGVTLLSVPVR